MEMLTTILSGNRSFKLPERIFRVFLKVIERKGQTVVFSENKAVDTVLSEDLVVEKVPVLKIAKTTWPDERLDFNQTFRQIRLELDEIYREQNPGFHSTSAPSTASGRPAVANPAQRLLKTTMQSAPVKEIFHKEDITTCYNSHISPLWIAKTTMPDEKRDFNQTFLHIYTELNKFYKAKNPVFGYANLAGLWVNRSDEAGQQLNPEEIISLAERPVHRPSGNRSTLHMNSERFADRELRNSGREFCPEREECHSA